MATAGFLEAQWRFQAGRLVAATRGQLRLLLASQGKLLRSRHILDPFYALGGLLAAGQRLQGSHTPEEFRHYCPSAATAAWFLGEASELLVMLDEAAALCSCVLEELGSSGAEALDIESAIRVQLALKVSELAAALGTLQSGVVQFCLAAEPRGASVQALVTNCTRHLVTCFGVGARALEWVHSSSAQPQVFPKSRLSTLCYSVLGPVGLAGSGNSPLQLAARAPWDTLAGAVLAGLRRCAGLLASPEHLEAPGELLMGLPGSSMHNLWHTCADLLYKLFHPRGAVFTGLWDALRADRACTRALLTACACFHTTIIARPVEEWRDEPWSAIWSTTASCALALSEAATDAAALDFTPNPLRRELLAVLAGLERLLGAEASPIVVSGQAFCCRLLVCDAQQHFAAWQAEKQLGRGQPYLPPEALESLAAGVSGNLAVLGLAFAPGAPGGVAGGWQAHKSELPSLAASLGCLMEVCEDVIEALAGEGPCRIGPSPLAAAKATEACLRLAAVLPEWVAGMQRDAASRTALADLRSKVPRLLKSLTAFALWLASGISNTIVLEGRVPSAALSAAAYNCAASAAKVAHRWAGLPAGSPARALVERVQNWRSGCMDMLEHMFSLALQACRGEENPREVLALTARVGSAVTSLAQPTFAPAKFRLEMAGALCGLLGVLGKERTECIQCAMLSGIVEAAAAAAASALEPEACGETDKVAAFVTTSLFCHVLLLLKRCPWTAALLVDAGVLEGLARWVSQHLGRRFQQRSDAADAAARMATTLLTKVRRSLAELVASSQPPGISFAAREALERNVFQRPESERGQGGWASAALWDVQIGRRLLPLMREAAASLKQQAVAAGGSGPLTAAEAEALQHRIAAALAEGRSCANPACGQCRGASEARERLKRCSRCGVAAFCSPACMRQAWPQHRRVCRPKE